MSSQSLLDAKEACARLGVGKTTLYMLVKDEKLRPVRIGRKVLFRDADLETFINSL
ncbi:MAG: helix-turn-helix domain-containing protein [Hyphomicrobiales bacterium]|nr:helix-turn-helix domain-containing protein [Hyphomicrobiales bacterium]